MPNFILFIAKANGRANSVLKDKNILDLAKYVSPKNALPLGLEMDLTTEEVEQIEAKSCNLNDKKRVILDIIRQWCDSNIAKHISIAEIVDRLINIFKKQHFTKAMRLLQELRDSKPEQAR